MIHNFGLFTYFSLAKESKTWTTKGMIRSANTKFNTVERIVEKCDSVGVSLFFWAQKPIEN